MGRRGEVKEEWEGGEGDVCVGGGRVGRERGGEVKP